MSRPEVRGREGEGEEGQEGEGDRTGKWMGCQLAITVTRVGEVRLQSAAELALTSSVCKEAPPSHPPPPHAGVARSRPASTSFIACFE